mgnify:CR=1 FL=1
MKETFGQWLKRIRKERRLSQGRTCLRAGVSSMTLFDLERDKTYPAAVQAKTLYGLAVTLDIDPAELLKRAAETDDFLRKWWSDPKRGEWR